MIKRVLPQYSNAAWKIEVLAFYMFSVISTLYSSIYIHEYASIINAYLCTLLNILFCLQFSRSTVNFNVTVLEYQNASFLSLSPADLDQVLNVPLEECVLSINTLIGKALEVDLTSHTTRITRELSKRQAGLVRYVLSHSIY